VEEEADVANQTFLMRRTTRAYLSIIAAHHHDSYSDIDAAVMAAADHLWCCIWDDLAEEQGLQRPLEERAAAALRAMSVVAACEAWRAAPPSDGDQ
jgi:hypothetical protein